LIPWALTGNNSVGGWLRDHQLVARKLLPEQPSVELVQRLTSGLTRLSTHLAEANRPIELLSQLVDRITISAEQISIELSRGEFIDALELNSRFSSADDEPLVITSPFQHRKRGVESKLIMGNGSTTNPDLFLISHVAKARYWLEEIKNGKAIPAIASEEGRSVRQIQRYLELAFLSPKLIQQIVEGTQPPELSSYQLLNSTVPIGWYDQHCMFGVDRTADNGAAISLVSNAV